MSGRDARLVEVLPDYRRWLHRLAYDLLPGGSPDHDDLVQEGYVAMWRALGTYDPAKGALPSWLTRAARHRMLDIRNHRATMTGTPKLEDVTRGTKKGAESRGRIRAYLRAHPGASGQEIVAALGLSAATVSHHRSRLYLDIEPPVVTSLDALVDEGFDPAGADDVVTSVIEAYHRGRIAQTLDILTPTERKYVVLRFWRGLGTTEMTREFGYEPHSLWRTARARLASALADVPEA